MEDSPSRPKKERAAQPFVIAIPQIGAILSHLTVCYWYLVLPFSSVATWRNECCSFATVRYLRMKERKTDQGEETDGSARRGTRTFSPCSQKKGKVVKTKYLLTTVSVIAVIQGAQCAYAQTAQGTQDQNKEAQIETVVVTAEKRSEDVQKVPVAVSVVSKDTILNQQIIAPEQLQYSVPSLQEESINNRVGAINFYIRGVGTTIYGPAAEASVLTVIDDVPLARSTMGVSEFFDIDHVEVLRGPQGMLFGKNASAGVVNIVTTKPKIDQWEETAHLSYGNMNDATAGNEFVAQGVVNVPISDDSAARVDAFFTRQDGLIKDVFKPSQDLGMTEYGARVKYLWEPTDNWEIYFSADYAHENGVGPSAFTYRTEAPGGFVATQNAALGITAGPNNLKMGSDGPTVNTFQLGGASLKTVYSFGGGYSLTDIAAFRVYHDRSNLDYDLLPISFIDTNLDGKEQKQASNELRLASPTGGRFEYQVGLFYLYVRDYGWNTILGDLAPLFPPPAPPHYSNIGYNKNNSTIENKNYAIFGQGKLSIVDNARLILGARLTHDDLGGIAHLDGSCCTIGLVSPLGPTTASNGYSYTNFSYKLGAEWDVTPDAMAYGTYTRGYKSPTFGGITGVERLKPEIPSDVELGLKSAWFDHRLVANLALFWTKFENYQTQAFDPSRLVFVTTNAGSLLQKGVELEFTALPIEGFTLTGGGTYNDAIYQGYITGCYPGEPSGVGRNMCDPSLGGGASVASGNQLANAPRWVATISADYERSISSGLNAFVHADYYYRSTTWFIATHDPNTKVGDYGLLGGSLGVETEDGHIRGSVFVRNLFDKRIPTWIVANPLDGLYSFSGTPERTYLQQFGASSFRTIGVSLDLHF
ncbi:MAG: TonB-dependent receptor [Alphaproteobacteria bacterium]|nr:TonB-dependent receptor [Alphaproteobacteria bacterium]MDE2496142.1 TonB-dependent receptor [Alphaproteobacteria bacterium]